MGRASCPSPPPLAPLAPRTRTITHAYQCNLNTTSDEGLPIPTRTPDITPWHILSILANAFLIPVWFVALHILVYAGADNAILMPVYYAFALFACAPVACANEFLLIRPIVSVLRDQSRILRAALLAGAAIAIPLLIYAGFRIGAATGFLSPTAPFWIAQVADLTFFAVAILFQITLALLPPCYLILTVRVLLTPRTTRA